MNASQSSSSLPAGSSAAEAVLFEGRGFKVSDRLLTTPRKTYAMGQIEFVSVERPLLFFVIPPALAVIGFAMIFGRYLYVGEIFTLLIICGLAILAAMLFGTLRVHSLALRDDEVAMSFGPVSTLRQVRKGVEAAMTARLHGADAP